MAVPDLTMPFEARMQNAIKELLANGMKDQSKTAKRWGVKRPAMLMRVRAGRHAVERYGGVTALPPVAEDLLVAYVVETSEAGFPLTPREVRDAAKEVAYAIGIGEDEFVASDKWYYAFMNRHKQLSAVKPQRISRARQVKFTRGIVAMWFETFGKILKEYSPAETFNCDDASFNFEEMTPSKVVVSKRTYANDIRTSTKTSHQTLMACGSADGAMMPLFMVFPGETLEKGDVMHGAPDGRYTLTPTGWASSDSWAAFSTFFVDHVKKRGLTKALLIVDGAGTHMDLRALQIFRENNVRLLALPPSCASMMQPLEVAFFRPMGAHITSIIRDEGARPTDLTLASIIQKAYKRMENPKKEHPLAAGFRATGLCPFNPAIFTEEDFAPSHACLARRLKGGLDHRVYKLSDEDIIAAASAKFEMLSPVVAAGLREHNGNAILNVADLALNSDMVIAARLAKEQTKNAEAEEATRSKRKQVRVLKCLDADIEQEARKAEREMLTEERDVLASAAVVAPRAVAEAPPAAPIVAAAAAPVVRKRAKQATTITHDIAVSDEVVMPEHHHGSIEVAPTSSGRKRRAPLR